MSSESHSSLRILIVGGGIGGLSTALALRANGHDIHIYESNYILDTRGAGIAIFPNGSTSLSELGIDVKVTGASKIEKVAHTHLEADGSAYKTSRDINDKSYIWHMVGYPDLLATLWEAVLDSETPGTKPKIYTSKRIERVDPRNGIIFFDDGSEAHGDLIIGADGVHSTCRSSLPGGASKQFRLQRGVFRAVVNRDKLAEDPVTRHLVMNRGHAYYYSHEDKVLSVCPTSHHQKMCIKFLYDDSSAFKNVAKDWRDKPNKSKLMHKAQGMPKESIALLEKIVENDLQDLPVWDMDPLSTYCTNRLVLMGDAAHPMPPYCGQRTAMALEDAVALGVLLEKGLLPQQIEDRLRIFSRVRHERIMAVQQSMRTLKDSDIWGSGNGFDEPSFRTYVLDHSELRNTTRALHTWKLQLNMNNIGALESADTKDSRLGVKTGAAIRQNATSSKKRHEKAWFSGFYNRMRVLR